MHPIWTGQSFFLCNKLRGTSCQAKHYKTSYAEPHSSVGSVADLRTGGRWCDPRLGRYSFRGLMIVICDRIHSSFTTVRCFDNGCVGKQPVA